MSEWELSFVTNSYKNKDVWGFILCKSYVTSRSFKFYTFDDVLGFSLDSIYTTGVLIGLNWNEINVYLGKINSHRD